MAVSELYYELERQARERYGSKWVELPDDHPLIIAMRGTFSEDVIDKTSQGKRKAFEVFDHGRSIGIYRSITRAGKALGLTTESIRAQINGQVGPLEGRYTFTYKNPTGEEFKPRETPKKRQMKVLKPLEERPCKVYTKGGKLVAEGTVDDCARILGIKPKTIQYYSAQSSKNLYKKYVAVIEKGSKQ